MHKHIFKVWIVFIIMIFGCSTAPNDDGILSIEIPKNVSTDISLSELSDSIVVIPLETHPQALITSIKDILLLDDYLILSTIDSRVLIFDHEGNFVQPLGTKGDGPGEYKYATTLSMDQNSGKIHVVSMRKILVFSRDFEFLEEKNLNLFIEYLKVIEDDFYAVNQEYGNVVEAGVANETYLYKLSESLEIVDTLPMRKVVMEKLTASRLGYSDYISKIGNDVFIYTPVTTNESYLRDTLYLLEGKSLTPFAKLNFPKPHIDDRGFKAYYIANMVHSNAYISSHYYQGKSEIHMMLHRKSDGKTLNVKGGFLDEVGEIVMLRSLIPERDLFYYVKTGQFMENGKEEANPVIGILRLK